MQMMIVFVYLFLFPILFVSTTTSSNLIIENIKSINGLAKSKLKQPRTRSTIPQSLTLLMNFKNDGTTSFQIMQGINYYRLYIHLSFFIQ
jgi:hypothetical protein